MDPAVTPLRLTRAPLGTRATAASPPGRSAFAAPFRDLRVRGSLTAGRFRAVTSHRFTRSSIETRWLLERRYGRARLRADALLPTWGSKARVVAVLRDGSRLSVRAGAVRLSRVARFEMVSERGGYDVLPLTRPAGAVARVLLPWRQSSNPDPGPTLAVELAQGSAWRRARFAVRIAVRAG
jgi:hypothetical protein